MSAFTCCKKKRTQHSISPQNISGNTAQRLCDKCVREDTKQALKENLQADGVQSRQTLFVRYCRLFPSCPSVGNTAACCSDSCGRK